MRSATIATESPFRRFLICIENSGQPPSPVGGLRGSGGYANSKGLPSALTRRTLRRQLVQWTLRAVPPSWGMTDPSIRCPSHCGQAASTPGSIIISRMCSASPRENASCISRLLSVSTIRRSAPLRRSPPRLSSTTGTARLLRSPARLSCQERRSAEARRSARNRRTALLGPLFLGANITFFTAAEHQHY